MLRFIRLFSLVGFTAIAASCSDMATTQSDLLGSSSDKSTADSNAELANEATDNNQEIGWLKVKVAENLELGQQPDRSRMFVELYLNADGKNGDSVFHKQLPYRSKSLIVRVPRLKVGEYKLVAKLVQRQGSVKQPALRLIASGQEQISIKDGAGVLAEIDNAPFTPNRASLLRKLRITTSPLVSDSDAECGSSHDGGAIKKHCPPDEGSGEQEPLPVPEAQLRISPNFYYNFGRVNVGTSVESYEFKIINGGDGDASAFVFNLDSSNSVGTTMPFSIVPNEASNSCTKPDLVLKRNEYCVIKFAMLPQRANAFFGSAKLSYFNNVDNSKSILVKLQGVGQ